MIRAAALLNLRHLRRQRVRTALSVVAIAAGVSLLSAVLIVSQSINASAASYAKALAGVAPLRVEGADDHGGVTEATLAKIRATPGVAAAVPIVVAVTTVDREDRAPLLVAAVGIDCSVEAVIGKFGCSSSAVVSAGVASPPYIAPSLQHQVGPGGAVHTDLNLIPLGSAPTLGQLDAFNHGRVIVFPLPEAQALFARPGRVDDVFVKPDAGVAVPALATRLRDRIGPQNPVVPADAAPPGVAQASSGFLPLLGVLGLAALAMGGILVANILNLSLAERRRELAVASALGAERRKVIGGILLEAAVLGLTGGILGAVIGAGLGHPLVGSISTTVFRLVGVSLATTVRPATVIVTILLAVVVSVVSAIGAARRATSIDLAAELSERREPAIQARSRLGRALALSALGTFGLVLTWVSQLHGSLSGWQPPLGEAGILASVALIAAVGSWTPLVLQLAMRATGQRSGTLAVAVSGLATEAGRTTGMAVAVATAVALGAVLSGMVPTLHGALAGSFGRIGGQRVYVSTVPINNGGETESKLNPTQLQALSKMRGVAGVGADYFVKLNTTRGPIGLSAFSIPPGSQPFQRFGGGPPAQVLASGQAMVGASLARVENLHTGSTLSLPSPDGMVPLVVGGIWEDANSDGLDIVVSQPTLLAHWGPLSPDAVFLAPAPGFSLPDLAARVDAAHLGPDVSAQTPPVFLSQFTQQITQLIAPFWVLQRALLALALLATLSTLLLVGVQRRRELGLLGALGLGPAGLARMTLAEAGCVGLVASVLGVGAGVGMALGFRDAAGYLFGLEPHLVLSGIVAPSVIYCLIALAAVVVGAGLPAWRTAQLQITEALRYE